MPLNRHDAEPLPSKAAVTPKPRFPKRVDELADAMDVHCLPRQIHNLL